MLHTTLGLVPGLRYFIAGVQLRFAPRLYGLGGYRWFNFKFPSGIPDDHIENSVFAGLRWDL